MWFSVTPVLSNHETSLLCTFLTLCSRQVLHGADRRGLLPPPLPAALPGPATSGAPAGGRNAELRRHRHELRRLPLPGATAEVAPGHAEVKGRRGRPALWGVCQTRGLP